VRIIRVFEFAIFVRDSDIWFTFSRCSIMSARRMTSNSWLSVRFSAFPTLKAMFFVSLCFSLAILIIFSLMSIPNPFKGCKAARRSPVPHPISRTFFPGGIFSLRIVLSC